MKRQQFLEIHPRRLHHLLGAFRNLPAHQPRDLVQEFRDARGEPGRRVHEHCGAGRDRCNRRGPNREFANLQEAIGTNDHPAYFPFFNAKDQLYPNTFILNRLQRDASGKIKLGLDLQGGTAFLVEMDTNALAN